MKIRLTQETLATVKATPDDAVLADWVVSAKTIAQPIEDAKALAQERIALLGAINASDGTQITMKVTRGAYKILDPVALWHTVKDMLTEERMAAAVKWSMTSLKDGIAEQFGCPKTGKAPVTAESIFDARIRLHVEQGERKVMQFL